jgi:micrococcal nuclease
MNRRRFTRRQLAIALALALLTLSALDHAGVFGFRGSDRVRYTDAIATVIYVADGDTFDIDMPDGRRPKTRIRLWGVDCPEISHEEGVPDAHFGRESADFVQEHLVGRQVRIALDPNRTPRGKYGRLLAYVYLEDTGEMLNELLIAEGLAYADRRFKHAMKQRFIKIEKRAMKAGIGLWETVTPEQMPDWRQRMDAVGAW